MKFSSVLLITVAAIVVLQGSGGYGALTPTSTPRAIWNSICARNRDMYLRAPATSTGTTETDIKPGKFTVNDNQEVVIREITTTTPPTLVIQSYFNRRWTGPIDALGGIAMVEGTNWASLITGTYLDFAKDAWALCRDNKQTDASFGAYMPDVTLAPNQAVIVSSGSTVSINGIHDDGNGMWDGALPIVNYINPMDGVMHSLAVKTNEDTYVNVNVGNAPDVNIINMPEVNIAPSQYVGLVAGTAVSINGVHNDGIGVFDGFIPVVTSESYPLAVMTLSDVPLSVSVDNEANINVVNEVATTVNNFPGTVQVTNLPEIQQVSVTNDFVPAFIQNDVVPVSVHGHVVAELMADAEVSVKNAIGVMNVPGSPLETIMMNEAVNTVLLNEVVPVSIADKVTVGIDGQVTVKDGLGVQVMNAVPVYTIEGVPISTTVVNEVKLNTEFDIPVIVENNALNVRPYSGSKFEVFGDLSVLGPVTVDSIIGKVAVSVPDGVSITATSDSPVPISIAASETKVPVSFDADTATVKVVEIPSVDIASTVEVKPLANTIFPTGEMINEYDPFYQMIQNYVLSQHDAYTTAQVAANLKELFGFSDAQVYKYWNAIDRLMMTKQA